MKSVFAAILAVAAAAVSAQTNIVSISSPLSGTVYTAGKDAVITWVNPTVDIIPKIVLSQGSSTSLQQVSVVATNVDAKAQSYTWSIPVDTPAGTDYAFALGNSPDISYTGQFSIKASDGSAPPPSSSASSAPANPSGSSQPAKPSQSSGSSSSSAAPSSSGSQGSNSAGLKVSANHATAGVVAIAAAAMLM